MIYEIDLFFCAISAFFFKNFLTFAFFLFLVYFLFKYLIQKLGNITIILYFLFMISIFAGGVVLSCIPKKEDVLCSIVVDSYYIGVVSFALFILLLISIIRDLIRMPREKKEVVKKEKKTKKKKE